MVGAGQQAQGADLKAGLLQKLPGHGRLRTLARINAAARQVDAGGSIGGLHPHQGHLTVPQTYTEGHRTVGIGTAGLRNAELRNRGHQSMENRASNGSTRPASTSATFTGRQPT